MVARVLITGASGFIGGALMARCAEDGLAVRITTRRTQWPESTRIPAGVEVLRIDAQSTDVDWCPALVGRDVVVHCAARVHLSREPTADPLGEYRRANTDATLTLARRAAAAGVRRFIFISSIGVNGSETQDRAFTPEDTPQPDSPYAHSKLEAEEGLFELAVTSGMEMVVIRPPLVYGPDAPGNFAALVRLVNWGIPLPFGAVHNRRSLVALGNVVDLIAACIDHPRAINQVLLVSDGEDLSTTELLTRMAKALGRPPRLIPVPSGILRRAFAMLGAADRGRKLLGSLQVDISKTRGLLDWNPVLTVDEGIRRAIQKSSVGTPKRTEPASISGRQ